MKKIFSAMVIGSFLALITAVSVHAQMPGTAMRINVPFEFFVSGKLLPAGDYEIRRFADSPSGLLIRNLHEQRDHAMFETESVEQFRPTSRDEVIFNRYGNTYFLSEVLTGGEQSGRELAPSRAERQLRREMEMASNQSKPETVVVASIN